MVDPTDFNLQSQRTRTFKGFVQFQSPQPSGTGNDEYFRLKERQSCTINFRWQYAEHYSDAGQKALDPSGYNHDFTLTLKTTSDLFDDTWSSATPSDNDQAWQTLSYWMARADANDPIEVVFLCTMTALAGPTGSGSSETKYMHMKFVLQPEVFGNIVYGQGGSQNITVSGSVLSINYIKRSDTEFEA